MLQNDIYAYWCLKCKLQDITDINIMTFTLLNLILSHIKILLKSWKC